MINLNPNKKISLLLLFFYYAFSVDHSNFKTCDQSSFCKRQRHFAPRGSQSEYCVIASSVAATAGSTGLTATLTDGATGRNLSLRIVLVSGGSYRVHLNETDGGGKRRFEIPLGASLLPDLQELPARISWPAGDSIIRLDAADASHSADSLQLLLRPFRIDLQLWGRTVASVNSRGLLNWEFRGPATAPLQEKFRDHSDSVPNGPSSVGTDVSFPCATRLYGIPEHADRLPLRSTARAGDPYRLYNLDVFEYELDSRMALYGSVPVMYAHGVNATAAVFWHNAAETWVDIDGIDTHWISESGVVDLFLMAARSPLSVIGKFAALVGTTPLPPLFALGYHQSRWNYQDETDATEVDRRFNEADFPYDALWLDIEHTDGKRCFTWDAAKFPDPQRLIDLLDKSGRKLVTIVDPHVKRDDSWTLYKEVRDHGFAVRRPGGEAFDGWCWPGTSVWPDFISAEVRSWWSRQFLSYPAAFSWNDMNEPSVFSGPEVTMPKDVVHSGGWEHRDVHNLYGALVHRASWDGQLLKSPGRRPFVLTRALFAGSQRTAATWTGDNAAKWSHLKVSEPMLMSLGLAGITLAGADVGGFFGDPDPELLTRWYQAGAMQPFFRAHAHLDSKRREPWLFDKPYLEAMRAAVLLRYSLMPYIYTQFYFAQLDGRPVMAPMWVHHPTDSAAFDLDDQHLLGQDLLFKPVTEPGVTQLPVYLPRSSSWYAFGSWEQYSGGGHVTLPVGLSASPLLMRAGSIVARREMAAGRRSLEASLADPIGLIVLIDPASGSANGSLYVDDGRSLLGHGKAGSGRSILAEFSFIGGTLVSRVRAGAEPAGAAAADGQVVSSVAFVGVIGRPVGVRVRGAPASVAAAAELRHDARHQLVLVRRLRLPLGSGWRLLLQLADPASGRDEL